ncbi:hypothetical protein C4D60_Mb08t17510 [Musa balbisiana]|uniref:Uncharacterized protein n=1 Tax=Musa balbisiana TaxID=52838 RepID=A0A4S8K4J6_MUSBA|nr:hypothetical protein C4D60_Mb08t17510 [Musa balbisiana]
MSPLRFPNKLAVPSPVGDGATACQCHIDRVVNVSKVAVPSPVGGVHHHLSLCSSGLHVFYIPNPSYSLEGSSVHHVHQVYCAPFHTSSMYR